MILEMERHREPLLIISHQVLSIAVLCANISGIIFFFFMFQGILRIIYAFYMGLQREDAPYASIPLNTVVELTPTAFSCSCKRHKLHDKVTVDGQNEPVARVAGELDPPSH